MTFWILILSLGITLGGCQGAQPDRATVTQALNQHLQVTQHQLNALFPQPPRPFHLSQVHISQRLPLTIDGSPAYRVQGEYSLRYDRPLTPETSPETRPETWPETPPSHQSGRSTTPLSYIFSPQLKAKPGTYSFPRALTHTSRHSGLVTVCINPFRRIPTRALS